MRMIRTALLLTMAGASFASDSARHPIAAWDFNGDGKTTVRDGSGNERHGEMRAVKQNAPSERTAGMVGQAVKFSAGAGTDIVVKNHPRLNPTTGLTVAAWIKHEGPIGPAAEIVGKKGQARSIVDGYRFWVSRAGRLHLEVGDGKSVYRAHTERNAIKPDHWYHVAATFSPGRGRIYINSRLIVDEKLAAQQIAPSKNNLVIGNFAGRRNAMPFNGLIDEVALFDAALDGDAIFRLAKPNLLEQ